MYAKLYETEVGQVLVKLDASPDEVKPEVRFFFEPSGLGVCSIAILFSDDDEGWDKAEKLFNTTDEISATRIVVEAINQVAKVV